MIRTKQRFLGTLVALGAVALVSAFPALAGNREVRLRQEVKLQGSVIPAGIYTLRWRDDGADVVELTVLSGKNVVARATGTRVSLDQAAYHDAVVFQLGADGERELSRILTAGRKDAIGFETTWTAKSE
jgi:hypothetical protein